MEINIHFLLIYFQVFSSLVSFLCRLLTENQHCNIIPYFYFKKLNNFLFQDEFEIERSYPKLADEADPKMNSLHPADPVRSDHGHAMAGYDSRCQCYKTFFSSSLKKTQNKLGFCSRLAFYSLF